MRTKYVGTFLVCMAFVAGCQSIPSEQQQTDREFDKVTGKLVMTAQDHAAYGDYEKAAAKLHEARSVPNLIPYEDSTISMMLGAYAYEIDDLSTAIKHFESAISASGLSTREIKSTQSNIAQLLIASGDYKEGANRLVEWMQTYGEKPKFIEYAMQAYVKADDYDSALPLAKKWFAQSDPSNPKPANILQWLKSETIQTEPGGNFKIDPCR